MIPTPNSFTDIDDWISELEFDHIISLLRYSQSAASNLEKNYIDKTLRALFNNLQVIKQYYDTKKRTPKQTMFDNIIMPHSILKPRSKQRSKRQKIKESTNVIYQNCGRSQCEMRFNGCPHSD